MVATVRVKVNYTGVGEVLKGAEVTEMVNEAAAQVAANVPTEVEGETVETDVTSYVTDRAAAQVLLMHPTAAAFQAKYGTLTRAAGAAGLEVSGG